jgi:hypothetical protein
LSVLPDLGLAQLALAALSVIARVLVSWIQAMTA